MLNQYAVDIPTLPVNQCFSHFIQILEECQAVLYRKCRAAEKGRQAFGTRMVYRETFLQIQIASSSAPYPQELNPWSSGRAEPIHSSTAEKNENQTPVQDQRCQSWTVSQKFCHPSVRGDSLKNWGADQQRLQISDLHFRQIPYTSNVCLLEDKIQD